MSLLTGACISFLGNTFWTSLTVFGMFFYGPFWSGNQRIWSNQTIKNQTIKNFFTDNRSVEMNTTHVRRRRQTLARKAQWTKEPPTLTKASMGGSLVMINDHCSVNKNSEVLLKIYMVEFEIWLGKWKNAPSIGSGIQAKSTNVGKFVHCIPYYRKLTLHQINANC